MLYRAPLLKCGFIIRGFLSLSKPSLRILNSRFSSVAEFEKVADETLESLQEYFDDIIDHCQHISYADTELSEGVLTVTFDGPVKLVYVLNRQSINLQLWLSSPKSGPKRYDYHEKEDAWIYRHNKQSLHQLLQSEIPHIVRTDVNFLNCRHSGSKVQK